MLTLNLQFPDAEAFLGQPPLMKSLIFSQSVNWQTVKLQHFLMLIGFSHKLATDFNRTLLSLG